jgi:hypothetical protein
VSRPDKSSPAYRAYWAAKAEGNELGMQRAMMAHAAESIRSNRSNRRMGWIVIAAVIAGWVGLACILLLRSH